MVNTNSQSDIRVAKFSKQRATRSTDRILNSYPVRTSFVCVEQCLMDSCCNAYNLGVRDADTRLMQCELASRSRTAVAGDVSAIGWNLHVREGNGWDIHLVVSNFFLFRHSLSVYMYCLIRHTMKNYEILEVYNCFFFLESTSVINDCNLLKFLLTIRCAVDRLSIRLYWLDAMWHRRIRYLHVAKRRRVTSAQCQGRLLWHGDRRRRVRHL